MKAKRTILGGIPILFAAVFTASCLTRPHSITEEQLLHGSWVNPSYEEEESDYLVAGKMIIHADGTCEMYAKATDETPWGTGLIQLTKNKWTDAKGNTCADPDFHTV
jgi:hypothetical protein